MRRKRLGQAGIKVYKERERSTKIMLIMMKNCGLILYLAVVEMMSRIHHHHHVLSTLVLRNAGKAIEIRLG